MTSSSTSSVVRSRGSPSPPPPADGRVNDATYAALAAHLSEVEIIELTYAVAMYKLHAVMCRALRLEFDDVDERIVEIAAPGAADADVMGTISMT